MASPLAGDDLIFPDSAAHKTNFNDLAAGTRFNTLQFTGSGYAITGNPIFTTIHEAVVDWLVDQRTIADWRAARRQAQVEIGHADIFARPG